MPRENSLIISKLNTVVVLTQLPLQSLLRRADYTGRISKWGTILGAIDINFRSNFGVSEGLSL